jgi:hypothetical protein
MISRGEIKKCGWKPIEDHKAGFKSYELYRNGYDYLLQHKDEEDGFVMISSAYTLSGIPEVPACSILFQGKIPKRYELQIIMRCLGIG